MDDTKETDDRWLPFPRQVAPSERFLKAWGDGEVTVRGYYYATGEVKKVSPETLKDYRLVRLGGEWVLVDNPVRRVPMINNLEANRAELRRGLLLSNSLPDEAEAESQSTGGMRSRPNAPGS